MPGPVEAPDPDVLEGSVVDEVSAAVDEDAGAAEVEPSSVVLVVVVVAVAAVVGSAEVDPPPSGVVWGSDAPQLSKSPARGRSVRVARTIGSVAERGRRTGPCPVLVGRRGFRSSSRCKPLT